MQKLIFMTFLVALSQLPSLGLPSPLTTAQKLEDFDQLLYRIHSGYGPLIYKQQNNIIALDSLEQSYRNQVAETKSTSEFYYLIRRFVAEFRDGHFRATLPTDYTSYVPVGTDLVN